MFTGVIAFILINLLGSTVVLISNCISQPCLLPSFSGRVSAESKNNVIHKATQQTCLLLNPLKAFYFSGGKPPQMPAHLVYFLPNGDLLHVLQIGVCTQCVITGYCSTYDGCTEFISLFRHSLGRWPIATLCVPFNG